MTSLSLSLSKYLIVIQLPGRLQQTACIQLVGILSLETCNLMLIEWQPSETFSSYKITSHRIGLRLESSKTNLYTRYNVTGRKIHLMTIFRVICIIHG